MKPFRLFFNLTIALGSILVTSCSNYSITDTSLNVTSVDTAALAEINKAQAFFESTMVRSRTVEELPILNLGNMIVDWEGASVDENDKYKLVSANLKTQYCLKVERTPVKEDSTKNFMVPVWPRLLVYTHKQTGSMKYYFLMLIPEKKYFKMYKHPDWSNFDGIGNFSDYSGYAMYVDGENYSISLLSFYRDGVLKYRASAYADESVRDEHIVFMQKLLNNLHFKKFTNIVSRSNEERPIGIGTAGSGSSTPHPTDTGEKNDNLWDDLDENNTGHGSHDPGVTPQPPASDNGVTCNPGGDNIIMNNIRSTTGINNSGQNSLCACISYILLHNNKTVSTSSIIDYMENFSSGMDLVDNLLYPADELKALNVYFNVYKPSYITDGLRNNRFTVGVFHPYGDEDFSRAVVIVGENGSENKLIYWDPAYDCLMKRPLEDFDSIFTYVIKSMK